MQTYFWVKVVSKDQSWRFGPYSTFEMAAEILIENAQELIAGLTQDHLCAKYMLTEEAILNGEWALINIKVETQ